MGDKQMSKTNLVRRWWTLCMSFAIVLGIFGVYAQQEAEAAGVRENQLYQIRNKYTNKILTRRGYSEEEKTIIEQRDNPETGFRFLFVPSGVEDYYRIVEADTGYEFSTRDNNEIHHKPVLLSEREESDNRLYKLIPSSNGTYKIQVKHSGQVLMPKEGATGNGIAAVQYPDEASYRSQDWYIEEVTSQHTNLDDYINHCLEERHEGRRWKILEGAYRHGLVSDREQAVQRIKELTADIYPDEEGYYRIKSKLSGYYFNIKNNSNKSEAAVLLQSKEGKNGSQIFAFHSLVEGGVTYQIENIQSGHSLDVRQATQNRQGTIIQTPFDNELNQQFDLYFYEDGSFKMKVKHSDQFLTVHEYNTAEGNKIVQVPDKGSDDEGQRWILEKVRDDQFNSLQQLVNHQVAAKELSIETIKVLARVNDIEATEAQIEEAIDTAVDSYDGATIFEDSTGFITTYGMLNKNVDEITFMGVHNAFANNIDRRSGYDWDTYKDGRSNGTQNQDHSIYQTLNMGYRVMDLDIGDNGNGNTGSYHRYRLRGYTNLKGDNGILGKMKRFLDENPNEILIINVSEVYNGQIDLTKLRNHSLYSYGSWDYKNQVKNMLKLLRDYTILENVYNFTGDDSTPNTEMYDGLIDLGTEGNPFPTIKEMLMTDKRILVIQRDANGGKPIWFSGVKDDDPKYAIAENLAMSDSFINGYKNDVSHKYAYMEIFPDWGADAGDRDASKQNNDGRRLYETLTAVHDNFRAKDFEKDVFFITLDYVSKNKANGGRSEISAIEAANRANFDRFDYDWSTDSVGSLYWD